MLLFGFLGLPVVLLVLGRLVEQLEPGLPVWLEFEQLK